MSTSVQFVNPVNLPAAATADQQPKEAPIEGLVRCLNEAFETHGKGEVIAELMERYIANNSDWREYAHFCPHKYSRNLVARTKMYELMVICWGEGQKSPIHNHEVGRMII